MIISVAAHRQAAGLVDLAAEGKFDEHARGLIEVARTNPVRAVELIAALAASAAELNRAQLDTTPASTVDPLTAYLRRAHAAHKNGLRLPWVVLGEREYQRLKKRSQRARARLQAAS